MRGSNVGLHRPVLTAFRPSHTMAQIGPDSMSVVVTSINKAARVRRSDQVKKSLTFNETREEGLAREVLIYSRCAQINTKPHTKQSRPLQRTVLLEMLFRGSHELDRNELVAAKALTYSTGTRSKR